MVIDEEHGLESGSFVMEVLDKAGNLTQFETLRSFDEVTVEQDVTYESVISSKMTSSRMTITLTWKGSDPAILERHGKTT